MPAPANKKMNGAKPSMKEQLLNRSVPTDERKMEDSFGKMTPMNEEYFSNQKNSKRVMTLQEVERARAALSEQKDSPEKAQALLDQLTMEREMSFDEVEGIDRDLRKAQD